MLAILVSLIPKLDVSHSGIQRLAGMDRPTFPFFFFFFASLWVSLLYLFLLIKGKICWYSKNKHEHCHKLQCMVLPLVKSYQLNKKWQGQAGGYFIRRGVRGVFSEGGKVIFRDFFPGMKCFFPVENFHFGRPETKNISRLEKWKAKKKKKKKERKKKKSSAHFVTFHPSIFDFPSFFLLFCSISPFILASLFPGRSR